ncbi:MAG: radical SAM protein [bacterium]|nr:radical SAM protein [bacterium]
MMTASEEKQIEKAVENEKILLVLLPFWSPLIPPIGIGSLKSYLKQYGFNVKAVDAGIRDEFRNLYDDYFHLLREKVPGGKRGNFFSVGHDVLRNHLMAYANYTEKQEYLELIKTVVARTFYTAVDDRTARDLHEIVHLFHQRLKIYIIDLLEQEKPTVLGLSVYSDTLPASLFTFKLTRERYPHIKTVMGGGIFADHLAPGSENHRVFLEKTEGCIDKLFVGEGEILFRRWLCGQLPEKSRVYTLNDISCETLDLADVDILDMSDFHMPNYTYVVSYTSRSCPFQCSFCSETIQWGKYRKKSPQVIFRELNGLYRLYGSQLFLLSDSLLNPVIDGLAGQCLESDQSLYWEGWLRVDNRVSDREYTIKWRRGGFYHARLGLESGSQRVLDLMDKKITTRQMRTSVSSLAAAGIKTTTLWIVGHPGESEEDFLKTLDLIEELRNDIYEAECRPFYYFSTGQVASEDDWWGKMKTLSLYPETADPMLWFKTLMLDTEPRREIIYERMNRFVRHCDKLGVPNPYSMQDIYQADIRWQRLHKNAVPPLVDFKNTDNIIDENKRIQKVNIVPTSSRGAKTEDEYTDFGF